MEQLRLYSMPSDFCKPECLEVIKYSNKCEVVAWYAKKTSGLFMDDFTGKMPALYC